MYQSPFTISNGVLETNLMVGQTADEIVGFGLIKVAQNELYEPARGQRRGYRDSTALYITKGEMAFRMGNIDMNAVTFIEIETQGKRDDAPLDDLDEEFITHVSVRVVLEGQQIRGRIERKSMLKQPIALESIHQLKQSAVDELHVV